MIERRLIMEKIKLNKKEYIDKVKGCWIGKNIGGTLGAPFEGEKFTHSLKFYDKEATKRWLKNVKSAWERSGFKFDIDVENFNFNQPLPNDDLDFQLVWLKMLEEKGVNPTLNDFIEFWKRYLYRHWYSEYSWCLYNLKRGLKPPISGYFQNYFIDEMGSPIRSEIWACVAPGDPQLAAYLAWLDSCLDHTGGEGTYGEMFLASIESAAFVVDDPITLINIGLSMIPTTSNIARSVREAVRCYKEKIEWDEARERIATIFGHHNACNAIPNVGFIILGFLYGDDFGDKLCKAVNCGYDTDCTGATVGSLLGILNGFSKIPEEWKKPVGDLIIPLPLTVTDGLPLTITELTERTVKVAEKMIEKNSKTVEFAENSYTPEGFLSLLFENEKIRNLLNFDIHSSVENIGDLQVVFHYCGEPIIYSGIEKTFKISFMKDWQPLILNDIEIKINPPLEWKVVQQKFEKGIFKFKIFAEKVNVSNKLEIDLRIENKIEKLNFTIIDGDNLKIFPSSTSAPKE
ncbi:MAG: ADP-ribosylglycohydrolase family protein [Candidatus Omnitrophica bacterium]|nr:ADP-ribosylglycohydrolase family protein [Candidatus Omnitrophota bacterium]MCM8803376.1 ADP-ribosylglycohydrolase family protein [Candidatus Omnitrophota bacterium]